jgi:hypothetical protein
MTSVLPGDRDKENKSSLEITCSTPGKVSEDRNTRGRREEGKEYLDTREGRRPEQIGQREKIKIITRELWKDRSSPYGNQNILGRPLYLHEAVSPWKRRNNKQRKNKAMRMQRGGGRRGKGDED